MYFYLPFFTFQQAKSDLLDTFEEVGKCSTRGESWGMYITFASAKIANKAEPTLALKPRGDVTRNPKQGTSGPQKRTCVRQKTLKKKKKKKKISKFPISVAKR